MTLELYKRDTCPYCQRVLRYLAETGRTDVIMRDIIADPKNRQDLVAIGGADQVPCLFIDGKPLYESLDIIDWLKAHPQA